MDESGLDTTGLRDTLAAANEGLADLPADEELASGSTALGHSKLESTVRYPGIDVDVALEIAEQTDVQRERSREALSVLGTISGRALVYGSCQSAANADIVLMARRNVSRTIPQGLSMDNVKLLKNLYDAFARGDIPTVLGAMSPDIHWHQAESNPYMPTGEAWVGPDAVLNNLFMRLGAEWDGFSVHPKSFHDAGDCVIVEARYSGLYKTTGKTMDTQVCHVWHLTNAKVSRFQQYADTAKLQDTMGAR